MPSWLALHGDVVAAVVGMGAASLLCRAGGYAVVRVVTPPPFVEALLRHLPGAIFVAFLGPALARGGPTYWCGGVAVVAVMALTKRLPWAILAGVVAAWGVRLLGLG